MEEDDQDFSIHVGNNLYQKQKNPKSQAEWASIVNDAVFFKNLDRDVVLGNFLIMCYKDPKTKRISSVMWDLVGEFHNNAISIDPTSRYYPACENLLKEYADSNVRKCIAVSVLKTYSLLNEEIIQKLLKMNQTKQVFDWDQTVAGELANNCKLVPVHTPKEIGETLMSLGFLQNHRISSILLDVAYENKPETLELNNQLVFYLGEQLEQLFDPLCEYSPEQHELEYKPDEPVAENTDEQLIQLILQEMLNVQTNFTLSLVDFLQKFLIPLRIRVLNEEIYGLSTSKLNRLFPPTIDEVTRINCIFLDALKVATPLGSYEVLKACAVTFPYFYKAYTRHEAATKKFNKDIKLFMNRFENHVTDFYSTMEMENIIRGPAEKLTKLKLILQRLMKSKKWATTTMEEQAKKFFQSSVEIIDSFATDEIQPYTSRVFTPSGKILTELAKGWPTELQYKWLKRRIVGVYDFSAANDPQERDVVVIFSDYVVFLNIVNGSLYYQDGINKPLISDILMNSLINEVPLPTRIPKLKVRDYAYISDVLVSSYGEDDCLQFSLLGDEIRTFNYKVVSSVKASSVADLTLKAQILEKGSAFHLFKASNTGLTLYSTAHEFGAYHSETVKSPFAVFLNIPADNKLLSDHNLYVAYFATLLDNEIVKFEKITIDGDFSSIKIGTETFLDYLVADLQKMYPDFLSYKNDHLFEKLARMNYSKIKSLIETTASSTKSKDEVKAAKTVTSTKTIKNASMVAVADRDNIYKSQQNSKKASQQTHRRPQSDMSFQSVGTISTFRSSHIDSSAPSTRNASNTSSTAQIASTTTRTSAGTKATLATKASTIKSSATQSSKRSLGSRISGFFRRKHKTEEQVDSKLKEKIISKPVVIKSPRPAPEPKKQSPVESKRMSSVVVHPIEKTPPPVGSSASNSKTDTTSKDEFKEPIQELDIDHEPTETKLEPAIDVATMLANKDLSTNAAEENIVASKPILVKADSSFQDDPFFDYDVSPNKWQRTSDDDLANIDGANIPIRMPSDSSSFYPGLGKSSGSIIDRNDSTIRRPVVIGSARDSGVERNESVVRRVASNMIREDPILEDPEDVLQLPESSNAKDPAAPLIDHHDSSETAASTSNAHSPAPPLSENNNLDSVVSGSIEPFLISPPKMRQLEPNEASPALHSPHNKRIWSRPLELRKMSETTPKIPKSDSYRNFFNGMMMILDDADDSSNWKRLTSEVSLHEKYIANPPEDENAREIKPLPRSMSNRNVVPMMSIKEDSFKPVEPPTVWKNIKVINPVDNVSEASLPGSPVRLEAPRVLTPVSTPLVGTNPLSPQGTLTSATMNDIKTLSPLVSTTPSSPFKVKSSTQPRDVSPRRIKEEVPENPSEIDLSSAFRTHITGDPKLIELTLHSADDINEISPVKISKYSTSTSNYEVWSDSVHGESPEKPSGELKITSSTILPYPNTAFNKLEPDAHNKEFSSVTNESLVSNAINGRDSELDEVIRKLKETTANGDENTEEEQNPVEHTPEPEPNSALEVVTPEPKSNSALEDITSEPKSNSALESTASDTNVHFLEPRSLAPASAADITMDSHVDFDAECSDLHVLEDTDEVQELVEIEFSAFDMSFPESTVSEYANTTETSTPVNYMQLALAKEQKNNKHANEQIFYSLPGKSNTTDDAIWVSPSKLDMIDIATPEYITPKKSDEPLKFYKEETRRFKPIEKDQSFAYLSDLLK